MCFDYHDSHLKSTMKRKPAFLSLTGRHMDSTGTENQLSSPYSFQKAGACLLRLIHF